MLIKSASKIRSSYNEISGLCKETGSPIYLTQNGEGDLVVMDISAFEHVDKMFKISDELEKFRKSKIECDITPMVTEKVEVLEE